MLEQIPIIRGVVDLSNDGGPWVPVIFSSGVLMWALIIERFWYFTMVLPKQAAELQSRWLARKDHTSWCARQIRTAMISRRSSR